MCVCGDSVCVDACMNACVCVWGGGHVCVSVYEYTCEVPAVLAVMGISLTLYIMNRWACEHSRELGSPGYLCIRLSTIGNDCYAS